MTRNMRKINVGNFAIGDGSGLVLIAGPCVMESEELVLSSAEFLKDLADKLQIPLIFKSSYDKANRSSVNSFRGPGLDQGLFLMEKVKKEFDLPVVTDVHSPHEAMAAGQVCDVLQIPAFLSRQTDLLLAAAHTGKVVKVKKGQFMAPLDMKNVVEKIESTGNQNILLTDRGTSFGYNNLVSDMRGIPLMQSLGVPVCFDATHSVQLPGGHGASSGGERQFVETLARSAVAAGCDAVFLETHPDPARAKSDKDSQIPHAELEEMLRTLQRLYAAVHQEVAHV